MALASKTFAQLITFTRASTAMRTNASGLLESVAADLPRIDHDPVNLATGAGTQALTLTRGRYAIAVEGVGASVTASGVLLPGGAAISTTVGTVKVIEVAMTVPYVQEATPSATAAGQVWRKPSTGEIFYSSAAGTGSWSLTPPSVTLTVSGSPTALHCRAVRGLLIEEQRTNLLTYSEQFDNAAWSKSSATIEANSALGADGTLTADKLIESTDTAQHFISSPVATTIVGAAYTASVELAAAGRSFVRISRAGGAIAAAFDLSSGVVAFSTADNATITLARPGVYRCSITFSAAATSTAVYVELQTVASASAQSYLGDGTSGVYIWGAQLEAGSFQTSYIKTEASQVTRAADSAVINTLSPWYRQDEGTLVVEYYKQSNNSKVERMISISDGSFDNRLHLIHTAGNGLQAFISSGGTTLFSPSVAAPTAPHTTKMALAYGPNNNAFAANGALIATHSASALVPVGMTTVNIGRGGTGSEYANAHIRDIQYFPKRLTNAELQALTA